MKLEEVLSALLPLLGLSPFIKCVNTSLENWQGERMLLSRSWVDKETAHLHSSERDITRLARQKAA